MLYSSNMNKKSSPLYYPPSGEPFGVERNGIVLVSAGLDLNQRPPPYQSGATNQLSYQPFVKV